MAGSEGLSGQENIDTGLACLVLLLKFLQVPADPEQLRHMSGEGSKKLTPEGLVRVAKSLDVKAKIKKASTAELAKLPLPAIVEGKDGTFFILARVKDEEALIQSPLSQKPEKLDFDKLSGRWTGKIILLTTRAMLAGQGRKFDVTWFIPALVRYRGFLGKPSPELKAIFRAFWNGSRHPFPAMPISIPVSLT